MENVKDKKVPESALDTITAVLKPRAESLTFQTTQPEALWHCLELICKNIKIEINKPLQKFSGFSIEEQLQVLCEENKIRYRHIQLTENWWRDDIGPILGFYESMEHPAAIIQKSFDKYLLLVPTKNIKRSINAAEAKKIMPDGFMFYRTLPDKTLSIHDIAEFSFKHRLPDAIRIITMQALMVILGLLVPIATGIIFDTVVPNADKNLLWQFGTALSLNVFIVAVFNIVLVISTIRIRLKITASLQAAIWDRLIRLPISFFRQFTSGDLATRTGGIDDIQQVITSSVFVAITSGLLSLLTLILMFYYSAWLTLGTLVIVAILTIVVLLANIRQIKYLRKEFFLHGKLTGLVLQFISSISKLKMTNSLARAFEKWAELFSNQNLMSYKSGKIILNVSIFSTVFAVATTITLFAMVVALGENLSFGNFITFNAAFTQFFAAIFAMVGIITSIITIIPMYERIKPILKTTPEKTHVGLDPGILTGKIDITHLSFRYNEESPVVFKDLSIAVKPGEFVAFVGVSGCGKSTLFKLLLGFEQPQAGKIYFSDRELINLDLSKIRKQLGVVLQDSVLFPGSILENIVGSAHRINMQEVIDIIKQVGLEEEINEMPMGLQTLVTEHGKTLSGGQRQRLLLARALLQKPRILLLDEATSSLDNFTQAKIYSHLCMLDITCLVVAHRLSTIKSADRIYVIDNGAVAEEGLYEDLINRKGLFNKLAIRQM